MKQLNNPAVPLPAKENGESLTGYRRFLAYCLAPSGKRSVDGVFRAEERKSKNMGKKRQAPGSIYRAAETHSWALRAAAYDKAVAEAEAIELDAVRRAARSERGALAVEFVRAARKLLTDPANLTNMPAGTSAAVVRAVQLSRAEFGVNPLPPSEVEGAKASISFPLAASNGPVLEIFLDGGDSLPKPASEMPLPDRCDPTFDPTDESANSQSPPALSSGQ